VTTDTSRDHDDAVELPKQQVADSNGDGVKPPPSPHTEKQIGVAKVEAIASLWSRNHLIVAYIKSVHTPPRPIVSCEPTIDLTILPIAYGSSISSSRLRRLLFAH
jgi:hypothetical protein